jgi:hypothetical protein
MLFFGSSKDVIYDLKSQLSIQLYKDFGDEKYILGMKIRRDRENKNLWLIHSKYVNSMLQHFCMEYCRPLSVLIYMGTKILVDQCHTTPIEMEDRDFIPYSSAAGILMYAMVYTRQDIAQVVGVLIQFMVNHVCKHWVAVKRDSSIYETLLNIPFYIIVMFYGTHT